MLIYADKISNRVRYAFHLVLKDVLRFRGKLEFTSNAEEYAAAEGPRVNYSNKRLEGLRVMPAHLLLETGITDQEIQMMDWNGLPAFFKTSDRAAVPFDPFAASFYLATRYEEYLPHRSDSHQRFSAHDSLAYREGFLRKPLVDLWALRLKDILLQEWPDLKFAERQYQFLNTIDVDNAWAFRQKGMMRTLAGFARDVIRFDFSTLSKRSAVLFRRKHDPYDTYAYLLEQQRKYQVDTFYFFLLGDYGLNDKNVPVTSERFQQLIKSIADYANVGIHPSYGSNSREGQLAKEIRRLAEITRREIIHSRQHFLKLSFPETYRHLAELDILHDYTMGFASEPGFRASLCSTYHHYDLDQESLSSLQIHPFAVMDGTLNEYMEINPDEAIAVVDELLQEVKAVNGTFTSLWHNETVNDLGKWKGWQRVYEHTLREGSKKEST